MIAAKKEALFTVPLGQITRNKEWPWPCCPAPSSELKHSLEKKIGLDAALPNAECRSSSPSGDILYNWHCRNIFTAANVGAPGIQIRQGRRGAMVTLAHSASLLLRLSRHDCVAAQKFLCRLALRKHACLPIGDPHSPAPTSEESWHRSCLGQIRYRLGV